MRKNFEIPNNLSKPPKIGEIVKGKIIGIGRSAVYLDLGFFGTGIIYGKEFFEGKEALKELKIGDSLFAKIIDWGNEEGYIELSISQAGKELAWQQLAQKKEKDEILKIKILDANKGGLLAEISGIPAFLPVSQLSSEHYPRVEGGDQTKILKELRKFVGKTLELKIFDLSQKEGKLILSEKAKEAKKIKKILENYKVGDIVEGEITAILDFGVFLKFPARQSPDDSSRLTDESKENLEGLIHISELDWQLIEDPSEIVKVGEKVKAKIIKISDEKVSLSLKALKKDPWKAFEKKHKIGEIISGEVSKFNPFGVFIKINRKIQGLCHISEFGSQKKMGDTLEIGKKYNFEILSIESAEHRLTLRFKK
ncbi:S1 RNA-binding domain-containing protein [Patescibacteria group bacterium]|nr:S1 RNA-binding domain-containing protein [Patescibacteria group bacterium]